MTLSREAAATCFALILGHEQVNFMPTMPRLVLWNGGKGLNGGRVRRCQFTQLPCFQRCPRTGFTLLQGAPA